MWLVLAFLSAALLGFYDSFKKKSLDGNAVIPVLFLNTLFSSLIFLPLIIASSATGWLDGAVFYVPSCGWEVHKYVLLKSLIVLLSWIFGYFGMKHLPLTITGPINATRPILVLVGALLIYGETLNLLQWCGILLGFMSLYLVSRIGKKEGHSITGDRWLWMSIGAMVLGGISGLYDKWLLRSYEPLQVQAWYSLYQLIIMGATVLLLKRAGHDRTPFRWKWTIPCIAIFLTIADMAYFYALSYDDSMISVVSMIRRGSVIVSFLYGVIALREKNLRLKLIDLSVLLAGLVLLVIGSK